ncbi:MAG TPA: antibiotic biosynthesis monooxygenase [Rhizobacter sp.]|nr:antibiotic biosynthesis monooxygenase [Rhizobacter sp.]
MSQASSSLPSAAAVFRIDRFEVPAQALPAFMERVRFVDQRLAGLPGCRQNLVLQQPGSGAETRVITLVEWASAQAMEAAKAVMQKEYAAEGFDPPAFMRQLGVRADMGSYSPA